MKLIIDIPENLYKWIKDEYDNPNEEVAYSAIENGTPVSTGGDLISRKALKKAFEEVYPLATNEMGGVVNKQIYEIIDNAPTVPNEYMRGYESAEREYKRPQGEWIVEKNPFGDILHCSICGAKSRRSEYGYYLKDNFCHDCGASMMKDCAENER